MMLPTVMMYLGEFALACLVTTRWGRKAYEEPLGSARSELQRGGAKGLEDASRTCTASAGPRPPEASQLAWQR